jgi:hypothetical protein
MPNCRCRNREISRPVIFHTRTASAFRIFALSLQSEIREDVGGSRPDSVFSQPVATAVLPRSREIDAHNVRAHHFNEITCAPLKTTSRPLMPLVKVKIGGTAILF